MKDDLVRFARQLGLPTYGYKPELSARIAQRLQGISRSAEPRRKQSKGPREFGRAAPAQHARDQLQEATTKPRLLQSEIGPDFHFTYLMISIRLAHDHLTYGDLVGRLGGGEGSPPAPRLPADNCGTRQIQSLHSRLLRRRAEQGKSLGDAAKSWNAIKHKRGDPRYTAPDKPQRGSR